MTQTKAYLLPKAGYMQSIDANGTPYYIPTAETLEKEALRNENKLLKEQLQAASDMLDFHEECLVEMANEVYK